jgi:soluble lytic murein transglycosylase
MPVLKKNLLVILFFLLTACVPAMTPPPETEARLRSAARTYSPQTLTDAGQGLRTALDLYKGGNFEAVLIVCQQVAELYPDTAWYQRSLFLAEQAFIQLDRAGEADAAMLRAQAEYPELADYAVSILADHYFSKARYTQAAALYQQVVERYPKSSLAERAAYQRARALLASSFALPAIEAFENFLKDHPRSEFAPDSGVGLGRALLADARPVEAARAFRAVSVTYPGTAADQDAAKGLADLDAAGVDVADYTIEELYERGKNLSRTTQHDKTVETFRILLEREPNPPNRPDVLLGMGIALYNLGKRGESVVVLEKLVKDYPAHEQTAEALLWIGKSYSKLGERENGIRTFQKIMSSYPECEWADDALFYIGNIYREANDLKMALKYYGRLASEYPGSKFADSAIWWKAWAYYGAGEYKKTEQTLQKLVSRYPQSFLVHQARYWQGKTAEKRDDPARAAVYYGRVLQKGPYTYYGYRAAERLAALGVPYGAAPTDISVDAVPDCGAEPCPEDPLAAYDTDDGPPVWTDETRQLLAAEPSFKKTLELMHLDMRKESAAELWSLQERLPHKRGAFIGLSKAFFDLGDYYRSLILVLRNYQPYLDGRTRETPADLWVLAYPQGYWDSIATYSKKYGQDPYFIAAIIREESQFQAAALSPAGARGVMQVMPQTGEWIARNVGVPGFDRSRLFEPDMAINVGTWYISHLMKRFKGDPLFVAAAYNAGPEAVTSWLGRNGSAGMERDVFVESIPFSETRGYVKKVLRNYAEYKRIYGKAAPAALSLPLVQEGTVVSPVIGGR